MLTEASISGKVDYLRGLKGEGLTWLQARTSKGGRTRDGPAARVFCILHDDPIRSFFVLRG